jgi:hypothetical protein
LGQNGQTNRVPCAFGILSTITDHPGLQSLYRTGSGGGAATFVAGRSGLAFFPATVRLFAFFDFLDERFAAERKAARRAAVRFVRVAAMFCSLPGRCAITARL